MGQRYRSSLPLKLKVTLHDHGELIGHYSTREIGFNGVLVSTGSVAVEKHDIVDLTLRFGGGIDKTFQMKAIVTHHSTNTVRLTFTQYYPEYFRILGELLHDCDNRSAESEDASTFELTASGKDRCKDCANQGSCCITGSRLLEVDPLKDIIRMHPRLRRGDEIFRTGEPFRSLYLIRSGTVKTWTVSEEGDEHIIQFHFPGDVLGLGGIGSGSYDCNATTLDSSSLCEIPFNQFQKLAEQYPSLNQQLLKLMSSEIVRSKHIMKLRGYRSAPARLASFLNELSQNLSARGFSSRTFNLSMGRRDIADYLGLAEETVSRTFSQFQDDGMLEVHRKYVRINDKEHLKKLCGALQNRVSDPTDGMRRRRSSPYH